MGQRPPTVGREPEVAPSSGAQFIEVHVAGWVISPGVVSVAEGSNVAEAIDAAGGLRPGASAAAVNLAAEVVEGQQIVIPGPEETAEPGETGPGFGADGRVSINRATIAELDTLPGVGPVLAERIVAHRDQNGPFAEAEDLLDVPGIGEAKLASIRDLIVIP